jgi:hypothetical protein
MQERILYDPVRLDRLSANVKLVVAAEAILAYARILEVANILHILR